MLLTKASVGNLFKRTRLEYIDAIVDQYSELFDKYDITTPNRINYLFAQVGHESAGYIRFEENLSYTTKRLMQVWPSRFPTTAIANRYSRNPEKLANYVYANRMGNGDESSGDGWNYRGRGPIQLTGRDAYEKISNIIGHDFVNNPDDIFSVEFLFESACAVWSWKRLNSICDSGHFTLVTKKINGGTHGLADRKNWLHRTEQCLNITPKTIQEKLKNKGFDPGIVDGIIGPKTMKAVEQFSMDRKINLDSSGFNMRLLNTLYA